MKEKNSNKAGGLLVLIATLLLIASLIVAIIQFSMIGMLTFKSGFAGSFKVLIMSASEIFYFTAIGALSAFIEAFFIYALHRKYDKFESLKNLCITALIWTLAIIYLPQVIIPLFSGGGFHDAAINISLSWPLAFSSTWFISLLQILAIVIVILGLRKFKKQQSELPTEA